MSSSTVSYTHLGALGAVHTLWLSCCHGYHAAALARFLLDTGDEVPEVHMLRMQDDYAETQWRGAPREGVHAHDRLEMCIRDSFTATNTCISLQTWGSRLTLSTVTSRFPVL